jgi:hypothetical protein
MRTTVNLRWRIIGLIRSVRNGFSWHKWWFFTKWAWLENNLNMIKDTVLIKQTRGDRVTQNDSHWASWKVAWLLWESNPWPLVCFATRATKSSRFEWVTSENWVQFISTIPRSSVGRALDQQRKCRMRSFSHRCDVSLYFRHTLRKSCSQERCYENYEVFDYSLPA